MFALILYTICTKLIRMNYTIRRFWLKIYCKGLTGKNAYSIMSTMPQRAGQFNTSADIKRRKEGSFMNKSLFDVSRIINLDGGKEFNVWNGDNMVIPPSFNPALFSVELNAQVSRFVGEEKSEIVTDEVAITVTVKHGFIVRIDWNVWRSDCDYGVLSVNDGSMAWNDELLSNTLQVILNHIRVTCATVVWQALKEEYNVAMDIDY